jgi:hypothetical protein
MKSILCVIACAALVPVLLLSGCGRVITAGSDDAGLKVSLSGEGKIDGIMIDGKKIGFMAETVLEHCDITLVSAEKDEKGYVFRKTVTDPATGNSCTLVEHLYSSGSSVRWEMEITGGDTPWTTPIISSFKYPAQETTAYWTTWGRPEVNIDSLNDGSLRKRLKLMNDEGNNWLDPLVPVPFGEAVYHFGAPRMTYENPEIAFCPFDAPWMNSTYDLFSVPIVSVIDSKSGTGMSIVLSPEDFIQDLTLETSKDGGIKLSRFYHRITATNQVRFALDIVPHKADWRSGLGWMTNRYPGYFEPVNSLSLRMFGTGAYSNHDVAFDAQKMKDMAFSVNWKASFDFPYMGMFLAPVKPDEKWKSFSGNMTSIAIMQDYSARMKEMGFFVLNYFNVTEFGTRFRIPAPPKSTKEGEEWKVSEDYLYKHFPGAILKVPEKMNLGGSAYGKTVNGGAFYTWEDGIVTDCGIRPYQDFLLDQADRHINLIPDSYGICIDRMDWLRFFNEETDDGRTWFDNKPAGSLILSWHDLMHKLGPLMHNSNKVIFVNNHTKRIDLCNHVDGFFDEFTYAEAPLNTTAFMALKKPFSGWTSEVNDIRKDGPDNFFQKYLYMGAFPMCPFPGNDHSIQPDEWADQQVLDYGPLLKMLKGREWVLEDNPVEVVDGSAKANIFKVPGGYVVPVVFGTGEAVTVSTPVVKNGGDIEVTVVYPGKATGSATVTTSADGGITRITVPLKRGCAMIGIKAVD